MAKKKKSGLHIGNYVIRPLGLTIIGLLLVALIVVGTLIIARSISGNEPEDLSAPDPTRQVITLTPDPTVEPEGDARAERDPVALAHALAHARTALRHHPLSGRDRGAAERA